MTTWDTIVAGVDASPGGVRAATAAAALGDATGATSRLVHVIQDIAPGLPGPPAANESIFRRAEAVRAARRAVMTELRAAACPLAGRVEVHWGRPAVVLRDLAASAATGALVLGAKRRPGSLRWHGGATAREAARIVGVPLMVAMQPAGAVRCVLAAVDLSPATPPTLQTAEEFARAFGAALRVIHVLEPVAQPAALAHAAREAVEDQVMPLVDSPEAEFVIRSGPARVILMGEVARWGADLLVVGSHGWGWADRALLGGVTEGLLNHLPTSLVVVPILAAEPLSRWERARAAVETSTAPAA